MIKKHRNLFKTITFGIVVLAIIAIIGQVYGLYDPKGDQFLTDDASTILGQNFYMAGNWWNDTYYNKHQMDCWAHNVTQPLEAGGVNNHIHSVYDIDFDESKGVMKVYSIIEDNNQLSKTTYADGTNTTLGRLAYEASKTGNIQKVYRAIGQAMNEGVVVNEQVITSFSNLWNVQFNDNEDTLYNNYKGLKSVQDTVTETGETVTINNEEYTIIGHFKVNYAGLGIESINIGDARWSDSNQYKEIYWRYADTNKTQNWHSNFNEAKSGKYELDGNSFDIAVKTSNLPSDGNYKITIKQKKFEYYKSRIVVTVGRKLQQFGMYAYDNTPKTYVAKAEWSVTRVETDKNLKIVKKDKKSGEQLTGAGFKIYAVLKNGTKGWVSGSLDADKKYESKATLATEYSDDVEIQKLKFGEYYIFETKAPDGYELSEQKDYKIVPEGSDSPSGEFAYVGKKTINSKSGKTINYEVVNEKLLKSLEIIKADSKDGTELTGAKFKIYAVLDKAMPNGTKEGWVSGNLDSEKVYNDTVDKATEYEAKQQIENLRYGSYYIYETKAPDQAGYSLKDQENYHKEGMPGAKDLKDDWVYIDKVNIGENSSEPALCNATNEKSKYGKVKITKIDKHTKLEIAGGEFKIYGVLNDGTKGWLSGSVEAEKNYVEDASKAEIYLSSTNIEKLKLGKYYIFETKAPEGYDMSKQDGYNKTDKDIPSINPSDKEWVYLGAKEIVKEDKDDKIQEFTGENGKVVDKIEGKVWKDVPDTKLDKVDNIYKPNTMDSLVEGIEVTLYNNENVAIATAVTDKNGYYSFTEKNASTYTGEDKNIYYWELTKGYVEFTYDNKEFICVDVFQGNDAKVNSKAQEKTITTDDLDDNKLTGTTGNNPGKASTYQALEEMSYEKMLENNKLISEKINNNTVTYDDLKETPLTGYYNNKTYTISDINLGIQEKLKPEFSITEDVAYMKVQFGDYAYRYEYMKEDEQLRRTTAPTVNQQVSARTFTAKIYPSDVAYNVDNPNRNDNEGLKVYMVYRIDIFNNTPHNYLNNYYEEKMYIESLTNTFDADRYVLSKDKHQVDDEDAKKDFDNWTLPNSSSSSSNAVASYDCNNTWRKEYKNGVKTEFDENGNIIEKGYVTTYIQYQLTESSVKKILGKKLTEADVVKAPSLAEATTFHEYWRTDNVWEDGKEKYYKEHKQDNYKEPTTSNKAHYLHKSENQTQKAAQLWMRFDLPEKERTLSGIVFEDTVTEESEKNNTSLGDGIYNKDTENKVSNVKVELVNSKDAESAVYRYEYAPDTPEKYNKIKAETTVETGGKFEFKGVVPGIYYVRFTYGDGSQKLYDPNGKVVKVKDKDGNETRDDVTVNLFDYKSTIIDSSTTDGKTIQAAMEANESDSSKAEWYKDITGKNYSTAVDSISQRTEINGYIYNADGSIEDKDGNKITPRTFINAYTPKISVTIEDSKDIACQQKLKETVTKEDNEGNKIEETGIEDSPYYEFDGFNFGIIPETSDITSKKEISKVSLKDQTGMMVVSADPKDKTASYVAALDETATMVKAEIEQELLYGSELEATYKITITNTSPLDYVEPEDSKTYGYYYKYGELTDDATQKKVTIKEVEDKIDGQYTVGSVKVVGYYLDGTKKDSGITITTPSGEKKESTETIEESEDGTVTKTNTLKITGWSEGIESTQSETIEYTANALLSSENEDEDGLINDAQVTKIKLDKLTTLSSSYDWEKMKTTLTVTTPTGSDRTNTYWIAGAIALIVLASGIVVLKKKVL